MAFLQLEQLEADSAGFRALKIVDDLYQKPSDIVRTPMHCFVGDFPDILVEPPISNETDHNMCQVVAILFIREFRMLSCLDLPDLRGARPIA